MTGANLTFQHLKYALFSPKKCTAARQVLYLHDVSLHRVSLLQGVVGSGMQQEGVVLKSPAWCLKLPKSARLGRIVGLTGYSQVDMLGLTLKSR